MTYDHDLNTIYFDFGFFVSHNDSVSSSLLSLCLFDSFCIIFNLASVFLLAAFVESKDMVFPCASEAQTCPLTRFCFKQIVLLGSQSLQQN